MVVPTKRLASLQLGSSMILASLGLDIRTPSDLFGDHWEVLLLSFLAVSLHLPYGQR